MSSKTLGTKRAGTTTRAESTSPGPGVDGVDLSLEAALLDRGEEHVAPLEGVRGRSHDGDALGHKYLVKGFPGFHLQNL
jgi:hypothetical protein